MENKTVIVGFPNLGDDYLDVSIVKKWTPTNIEYIGDRVFFKYTNTYLSMLKKQFDQIFNDNE